MAKAITWKFYDKYIGVGSWVGYEEYISEDGTLLKRVWDDGEEEIFEIN